MEYFIYADGKAVGNIKNLNRLYQVSIAKPFAYATVPSFSDAISFAKIFFPGVEVTDDAAN